jgi:hypothetical protein
MRAARIASLAAVLALVATAPSFAQYDNTPGVYPANIGVAPGLLPGDLATGCFDDGLGPDVYYGEVEIVEGMDGTYWVQFKGRRDDGAQLHAVGLFSSSWAGLKFGNLIVGSESVSNCITGIDYASLIEANVNGVGHVNGDPARLIAKFGLGGELLQCKIVPAPAPFR